MVFGLRYVDHVLWEPGLWLLVALSLVAAAVSLANLRQRGLRLPVAAAIVLFGPAILLNLMQPVIEKLVCQTRRAAQSRSHTWSAISR